MASGAVLWFGEDMSAVPLRNNKPAASAVRSVSVLGATGSIGDSTMDLLRGARDRYRVEALTANSNVQGLAKLAKEFNARFAAVADPTRLDDLRDALAGTGTECGAGESAIIEAASRPADWLMAAVSGAAGLKPALAAVDRGTTIALANKECLVCAGDFFMQRAAKAGACILPADSEHNALFQALGSGNREELVRVIITASGGPFRTWKVSDIEQATLAQALKHPNWSMGQKITIDSASMASAAVLWFGESHECCTVAQQQGRGVRGTDRDGPRGHRFDRRQHDGSAEGRTRPLPGRGVDRAQQCAGAGETGARIRRAICGDRRSGAAFRAQGGAGWHPHRMRGR